jgi:LuxR family transcriptional regulator, quorum-sensing system regulator SolR
MPLTKPKAVVMNNDPTAWQLRYQAKNYPAADPAVQHAMRSPHPILRTDALFSPTPKLWEEARSLGLHR